MARSGHEMRMKARRGAKAAKQAAYSALAGTSKKGKKVSARLRGASQFKHAHRVEHCGNAGCERCYPEFARSRRNAPAVR